MIIKENSVKPFLRWAGGKTWLIKHLPCILGNLTFNNYHELFLGGGAVFFNLYPENKSFLSDKNEDLVATYIQIRDNVEGVISHLRKHENTKDYYYWVRDEFKPYSNVGKAAKFIYLNQTSFNGIYRVNLEGRYNVPYGFRTKDFFQPQLLIDASNALKNTCLFSGDFEEGIKNVKENDLVFLDPPYTITHNNNGFFKYNEKLFSKSDQERLSSFVDKIKALDAFYIVTNAAHNKVKKIFDKGDRIIQLNRASMISGLTEKRGQYSEYIFTNIPLTSL